MRRPTLLYFALAALVASVAFADKPQTATAELEQLGASGIVGSADLKLMPDGDVRVHAQFSGLDPGVQYEAVFYLATSGCGSGTDVEIVEFTANAAGKATINKDVSPVAVPFIAGGNFISVEERNTTTPLSCGTIVPEL